VAFSASGATVRPIQTTLFAWSFVARRTHSAAHAAKPVVHCMRRDGRPCCSKRRPGGRSMLRDSQIDLSRLDLYLVPALRLNNQALAAIIRLVLTQVVD